MSKYSPAETVEAIRLVLLTLKELTEAGALAGVVLTDSSYTQVRDLFGPSAMAYDPGGFIADPRLENIFVVDGLLFMRGTQLQ